MKDFDINESSSFDLELEINGNISAATPPLLLFTIICEDIRLSLEAERIESGVYKITVPMMKRYLTEGEYDFKVEVIMDGKYFLAMEDKIKFVDMKPVVKIKTTEPKPKKKQPTVEVKIAKEEPKEEKVEVKETEVKIDPNDQRMVDTRFPKLVYINSITA
jgi:hypothetical protein